MSKSSSRPRLLILGSGWASTKLLDSIETNAWDITLVSPYPYFTFSPLLASAAVGRLSHRSIVDPVRRADRQTVTYLSAKAEGIDFSTCTVTCRPEVAPPWHSPQRTASSPEKDSDHPTFDLSYDRLVIAVGCDVATFNTEGVAENAVFFKDVKDASRVRNRLLECLDLASLPHMSEQQCRNILHFIVVGGGATGVELASELRDVLATNLRSMYPAHLLDMARVTIFDIANTILPGFDSHLQVQALQFFRTEGIKFHGEQHITKLAPGVLTTKELGDVPFGMLVWSTGIAATSLLKNLSGVKQDEKTSNFIVDEQLHVQSEDGTALTNVFAVGDISTPESGKLPPVGVVADQQGAYLARLIEAERLGKPFDLTFVFKPDDKVSRLGSHATAKEGKSGSRIEGAAAWALWREKYARTLSFKKRFLILFYGLFTRVFGRDLTRI